MGAALTTRLHAGGNTPGVDSHRGPAPATRGNVRRSPTRRRGGPHRLEQPIGNRRARGKRGRAAAGAARNAGGGQSDGDGEEGAEADEGPAELLEAPSDEAAVLSPPLFSLEADVVLSPLLSDSMAFLREADG